MQALLVSTYELGHQPFGLAHPAAKLRQSGIDVQMLDLSVQRPVEQAFRSADLIAFYMPMHTATRLATQIIPQVQKLNPEAHIAAYGLYAPMNEGYLRSIGVGTVLGGEFEQGLVDLSHRVKLGISGQFDEQTEPRVSFARQEFVIPDRRDLPPLKQYAYLELANGLRRSVGYTESSRGCKHLCRHCPVVPVYKGRFSIIARDIVLADIRQQVAVGAQHISFGDPDFFNGPTHGIRIVEEMHNEFPELSYDVTIKVEHLLKRADLLPVLKETGCLFVITAVESVQDDVLTLLDKGHTRSDFYTVANIFDGMGMSLAPTFVPFTPWTTIESYIDLLTTIAELGLVHSVSPVQLTIRLLIPQGSLLLKLDCIRRSVGPFDDAALAFLWSNPDPRIDDLHAELGVLVPQLEGQPYDVIFAEIWRLAHEQAGLENLCPKIKCQRPAARLSEPWYCCAEPTDKQMAFL